MEQIPEHIGRYEVISLVGRGASGQVFKARDPAIGRVVALKRFSMSSLLPDEQREEFKERFFREAQAAGNLKHPNIVTVHDVGIEEGVPFMAMEFVEGESLSKFMKNRGAIQVQEAVALVRQIACGLDYAHGRGVIHRDIKPDNILVGQDGKVVITDFGAARLQSSELTRTGEVLGTPHYMSPEQVVGDPLDGRSDLFSLGVILYLLLTGRRPFKGDTISSICYHIVHSAPDPVPEGVLIPRAALPVIEKLLSKKREERFDSGAALVEALDGLLSQSPGTPAFFSTTQTIEIPTPVPSQPKEIGGGTAAKASIPVAKSQSVKLGESAPHKKSSALFWAVAIGSAALFCLILIAGVAFIAYRYFGPKPVQEPPAVAVPPPAHAVTPAQEIPGIAPPQPPGPSTEAPPVPRPAPEVPAVSPPPPKPLAAQKRVSPQIPQNVPAVVQQPSAAVVSACYSIVKDAEYSVSAAQKNNFDDAYAKLDPLAGRLAELSKSVTALERATFDQADSTVRDAQKGVQQALAGWASKVASKARETYAKATEGVNDDEDGIINAYVQMYPVTRLKDRLPVAMRQEVLQFGEECRENLNDEEWERAESLTSGKKPGE